MANHLRNTADTLLRGKMALVSGFAWLISGLVLLITGWHHIVSPAEAMLADLLAMAGLTVGASLAVSFEGFLALVSILVGISIGLTGLFLLGSFLKMLLELVQ